MLITNAPTAFVEPLVIAAKLLKITDAAMVKPQAKLNNPGATNGERLQAAQTILDFLQARGLFMPRRRIVPRLPRTAFSSLSTCLPVLTRLARRLLASARDTAGGRRRPRLPAVTATVRWRLPTLRSRRRPSARGQITGPSLDGDGSTPVAMAAVQVRGSGELTYSDSTGNYLLAGLERGTRVLTFAAQGYQTREQTMTFSEVGEEQVLNVILTLPP